MTITISQVPFMAQQWMEAWNAKNPEAMGALFTADGRYEDFAFKISAEGSSRIKAWVQISIEHIPDLQVDITHAFQSGDYISIEWKFSGTPRMVGSVAGTGKAFDVTVFSTLELSNGKIARAADCYNLADMLAQIDVPTSATLPSPSWRNL